MSDELYAKFAAVLCEIFARLDVIEKRLDARTEEANTQETTSQGAK